VPLTPPNAVFRAHADHTRRDILRLLRAGPRTSGDIASRFDSSWPTISRHLAILRDAGLVATERSGQEIHYEVNTSVFQDLVQHLMEWAKAPPAREPARLRRQLRTHRRQEA
jgi:DNA-binding transcriptional ArsR family regulator